MLVSSSYLENLSETNINQDKKCIHTKSIIALFDLPEEDEQYKKISQHMKSCLICRDHYFQYNEKNVELKVKIPKFQIDNETKEIFEAEVASAFSIYKVHGETRLLKRIQNSLLQFNAQLNLLAKTSVTPKMLFTLAVAGGSFYLLRHYFN